MVLARMVRHVRAEARPGGALPTAAAVAGYGARWAGGLPRAGRPAARTFRYEGEHVPYARFRYNRTWLSERAVEVALALRQLPGAQPGRTLEVGNVLRHYGAGGHAVVDKYERAPGVVNADIADAPLPEGLELVVSVSTIEHVGFDEPVRDPDKPRRVLERLVTALAPGGRLWVTLPLGYNVGLDARLRAGELPFDRLTALRRVSAARNTWRQVPLDEVWDAPYDRLLWTATGLVVAERRV